MVPIPGGMLLASLCQRSRRSPWLHDGRRVDDFCPSRGQSVHLYLLQQGAQALFQQQHPLLSKVQVTEGTLLRYMST